MGNLFLKLKLPEIAGIVTTGVLIEIIILYILKDRSILESVLGSLHVLVSVALGIEAFSIGSEMSVEEKHEKCSKSKILILQVIFINVFTLLGLLIMKDVRFSLLIGAIVGATAPVAIYELTFNYSKDKKLTRGLNKMISFDNIVGIVYFFVIFAIVGQQGKISLTGSMQALLGIILEITFGALVGVILFLINKFVIRKVVNDEARNIEYVFFILSILLMSIMGSYLLANTGPFKSFFMSEFVVTFVAGIVFGNLIGPKDNHRQIHVIHNFVPPLLTVFFVYVGLELDFTKVNGNLGIFIVVFIVILVLMKMLYGYYSLKQFGINEKFRSYSPYGVITKSSFEIYLAHLAMVITHDSAIFVVIIISLVIFEALEPILLSHSKINQLEAVVI